MKPLYPSIKPYAEHRIEVAAPHVLYVEESGAPKGLPVLFVHGGPGMGTAPDDRRYFNPEHYRIILFDQRGCGHSTPFGSLEKNTTQDLVQDMEVIREQLGIARWILFGGSWGSTLSLVYAQKHPKHVLSLILRGIFLCRERDLNWFYQSGANALFPDFWEEFLSPITKAEQSNLIQAYYKRLTGEDEIAKMNAAKHWAQWEGQCAALHPNKGIGDRFSNPHVAMSLALMETHYFMNQAFLAPDQILRDAYKLKEIPGIIIHGRYDVICPLENARSLHLAWPNSKLQVIREAGHAGCEPGIIDALIHATEKLAARLSA